jgi:hypothetical protein
MLAKFTNYIDCMNLAEAIKTIEHYQKWRLGADIEMIHPKILTQALNLILDEVKKKTSE